MLVSMECVKGLLGGNCKLAEF